MDELILKLVGHVYQIWFAGEIPRNGVPKQSQ